MINNGSGEKENLYATAVVAKPGKKALAYFLDYCLTLFFSILLFALFDLISLAVPSYTNLKEETSKAQTNLYQIIYDSHLSSYDDGNVFMSEDKIVENYVYGIVLSSSSDETLSKMNQYKDKEKMDKETDRIFYYYNNYRVENKNLFEGDSYIGDEYLSKVFPKSKSYFEIKDGYPILNINSVTLLNDYILYSKNENGKIIYDSIKTDYRNAYKDCMNDIQTSKSYKETLTKFNSEKNTILMTRGSFLIIGYILATAISYILFPLIFKDGKTIGFKVFGLAFTTIDDEQLKISSILIKSLLMLIIGFSINSLSCFILFGIQGMYLLTFNIWGFINILYVSIFSLLLVIVSFFLMIFRKNNHQTLSETICMIVAKNTKEFKVENNVVAKEGEDDGKRNRCYISTTYFLPSKRLSFYEKHLSAKR